MIILLIHTAATLYMAGLIWFVQIVHYPLMKHVGREQFVEYETQHMRLTSYVVIVPMFVELITGFILIWKQPEHISSWLIYVSFILLVTIWLSTFLSQVKYHKQLLNGFNERSHQLLVKINWVRTVSWSLRSMLVCYMIYTTSKSL